ncbi:MAG: RNA polymerase sigma factor [bacterium]|nr:RNA polymerase sigma factor [bacterium]MDD5353724.1 RNA polymerase sigma factor [bacterium]MDD5755886.1 RNA polymerase sigma factor [bacterium]
MESKDIDQQLIEKIKNGDQAAFGLLLEKYQKRAYYFCLHLVSRPEDAEDLAQEGFVRVYKNVHAFRGTASFQTWFYQILLNLCRSYHRHRYLVSRFTFNFSQAEGQNEDQEQSLENSIPDQSLDSDPQRLIDNEKLKLRLEQALQALPRQQKEIFALKHFEELKINEIAGITGLAEGTVKSHLFRAVQRLQEVLKEFKER